MMDFEKGIDTFQIKGGEVISFRDNTLEQVKKEQEKKNEDYINFYNLINFFNVASRRLQDGIAIKKIHPNFKLITSDNPAFCDEFIYDPTAFIKLPLDEDHLLMLIPYNKDEQYYEKTEIVRSDLDEEWSYMEVHHNNINQIQNSERYVIGKKTSLEKARVFLSTFDEHEYAAKSKALAEKTEKLLALVEKTLNP